MRYKSISIGEAVQILADIEKEKRCLLLGKSLRPILRSSSIGAKNMSSYKVA